jgi:hypothetical protein
LSSAFLPETVLLYNRTVFGEEAAKAVYAAVAPFAAKSAKPAGIGHMPRGSLEKSMQALALPGPMEP